MRAIDFSKILDFILSRCELAASLELHGISHWKNVEQNALKIAEVEGADKTIVRLFAVFHDCKRIDEDIDSGHGKRAAEFIKSINASLLNLSKDDLGTLCYACAGHTDKTYSNDITIATCWDADRLDLPRVGRMPDVNYLNTEEAKRIAIEMFSNSVEK